MDEGIQGSKQTQACAAGQVAYRRDKRVVGRDEHKAARVDLMDALLGQVVTGVLRKGGDKALVSKCRHKRIATLYKITSPIGKAYVGQTMWPGTRINRHKLAKHSKCKILVSAVKKYGWDNMHVEILRGGPKAIGGKVAEDELDSLEEHYIASLNTRAPNGYNIQKGGKVAWRGAAGLSRREPRGPRPEHVKEKLRATWAAKREKRLQGVDPELARRNRHNAKKCQETRKAKADGTWTNGKYGRNDRRRATWEAKREAKLALLPPEEAAKRRAEMARKRVVAMRKYKYK